MISCPLPELRHLTDNPYLSDTSPAPQSVRAIDLSCLALFFSTVTKMQRTTPLAGLRPALKPGVADIPHVTTHLSAATQKQQAHQDASRFFGPAAGAVDKARAIADAWTCEPLSCADLRSGQCGDLRSHGSQRAPRPIFDASFRTPVNTRKPGNRATHAGVSGADGAPRSGRQAQ